MGRREGPELLCDREDRRGRRALESDGAHGRGAAARRHGSPADDDQHGHRGRRQERDHGVRRGDQGYLDGRAKRTYTPVTSDPDAEYEKVFEFDAEKVELGVARPMSPDNYSPLSEVAGTRLDQVFIGSCPHSRITDPPPATPLPDG